MPSSRSLQVRNEMKDSSLKSASREKREERDSFLSQFPVPSDRLAPLDAGSLTHRPLRRRINLNWTKLTALTKLEPKPKVNSQRATHDDGRCLTDVSWHSAAGSQPTTSVFRSSFIPCAICNDTATRRVLYKPPRGCRNVKSQTLNRIDVF